MDKNEDPPLRADDMDGVDATIQVEVDGAARGQAAGVLGRVVLGSDHSLLEHVSQCDAMCAWGEHHCPIAMWHLGERLCTILMAHAGERGDNEGALDTLTRIIRERDSKLEHAKAAGGAFANVLRDAVTRAREAGLVGAPPAAVQPQSPFGPSSAADPKKKP